MHPLEHPKLLELVRDRLAEYDKAPDADTLSRWLGTLRHFSLQDIERAFDAHLRDPDNGRYPPKPAHLKRAIWAMTASAPTASGFSRINSTRFSAMFNGEDDYRQACISSPAVVDTAHAIALRHGNRPWTPRPQFSYSSVGAST